MGVAFQGERGAFSEEAARRFFGRDVAVDPCETFADAFARVAEGLSWAAMMPVENSLAGSINEVVDLVLEYQLPAVGEVFLPVEQCLMALPGTTLADVKTVLSHPQALAQSSRFIKQIGAKTQVGHDTAGSARIIREEGLQGVAAIAAAPAAEIYGLDLLAQGIQNEASNFTRFFAIQPGGTPGEGHRKTSLVFRIAHEAGSLVRVLQAFAKHGLNLTKLESRPQKVRPWEYVFYLDVDGDLAAPGMQTAMAELRESVSFIHVIGCYPAASLP
ncbi:MAG: prephenate dehydratase [Candidatus Sericytochromatia bacterium]|nr:prephenate dehydratase [Candidatus Sericytochromatia bacterium]